MREPMKPSADIIGGFEYAYPACLGCGRPLTIENAWMTDGCPCNSVLGVNNRNETRWRLLMQLQQQQSTAMEALGRENNTIKMILAKQAIPCLYCGLEDMSKCAKGFPGCAKADDLICGEEEHGRYLIKTMEALREALETALKYLEARNLGEPALAVRAVCRAALAQASAVGGGETNASVE